MLARLLVENSSDAYKDLGLHSEATEEANSDKWMMVCGGEIETGADRNMWQRLGGYPKAIVERNPSEAREK